MDMETCTGTMQKCEQCAWVKKRSNGGGGGGGREE